MILELHLLYTGSSKFLESCSKIFYRIQQVNKDFSINNEQKND